MKKNLLLIVFSFLSINFGFSQSGKIWKAYNGNDIKVAASAERQSFPTDFKLMQFNFATMKQGLINVPQRSALTKSSAVISIPNANGDLERFEMYEASNFDRTLQAQFPEIRSYVGIGLDDKYATLRMSLDPRGIQTMVSRADKATEFIEPYSTDGNVYAVYSSSSRRNGKLPFTCSTDDKALVEEISNTTALNRSSTGSLKVFRLALSCNGEYANFFGATGPTQSGLVLAAFNATMTRVNGVFEKDFAIRMDIVASTTNVIFYNPATDPYSTLGAWNAELQNTLSSSLTGASTSLAANNAAYDVGHMFGATGGGGNAGCIGCVCRNDTDDLTDQNKGSGITSPGDGIPQGDTFDIDYVTHELGHQFGANHTFSNGNEGSGVNKEVGSGVTIMGYAGITSYDTNSNSIDIFHSASIAQVQANMAGKTCQTNIAITHGAPVVNAGVDITIPKSTPFVLTGTATDAGGVGNLTYAWEQNNDGGSNTNAASAASVTKTEGPNWANYQDSASPVRYFPRMSSILNGSKTTAGVDVTAEALSSVARTLDFRLTARDNVAGQGQTNFDDMVVTIDATRGPLEVTSQNVDGISWTQGQAQTITWSVNNTNTSVGGANVDILLSTDNGLTFATVLVANTPNDGLEVITVPSVLAPYCRVMVKASNSVFFNVNVKNIAIGYVVTTTTVCTDYTRTFSPAQAMAAGWTGYAIPAVTDNFIISDANLKIVSTAARTNQVSFGLVKPGSSTVDVVVFDKGCGLKRNINVVFDDEGATFDCNATNVGASYKPVGNLSSLDGLSSAGTWILAAKSTNAANTITSATLTLCKTTTTVVLASESFGINDLVLYPNPNNGSFNVQFTSDSGNEIKVNVHDMRGREIFNKSFTNNGLFNESLQLNKAQAGIYLVTIQDGAKKEVKKIVVE